MQTHVYANGREVCSKAADGKSSAAFPDVCWSPPAPPAGPIQLPYPNTAVAKDLANGTSTVFICGSMVARKDESYFSTSTGNEPATGGFPKGISTGVIQGKAYFTSWSMNVMVEGMNVTRHQDLMTHNHASPPPNSPTQTYIDDALRDFPDDCVKERQRISEECGPEPQGTDKTRGARQARRKFLKKVSERLGKFSKKDNLPSSSDNAWMEHCDGLWIKPDPDLNDQLKEMTEKFSDIQKELDTAVQEAIKPALETLKKELPGYLWDATKEGAEELAERAVVRWVVGLAGAAVGGVGAAPTEVVATAANIIDTGSSAVSGIQFSWKAWKAYKEVKGIVEDFDKAVESMRTVLNDTAAKPSKTVAEFMQMVSRINACTRARRCNLVDFDKTYKDGPLGGKGCCPGQTGHHVLPNAMTQEHCSDYKADKAPTLCVEGVNNSHGSHGLMHKALGKRLENYRNFTFFGTKRDQPLDKISYSKARDIGIESIQDVFPESKCSDDCLRAQLDKYYKDKCKKPMPPASGEAKPPSSAKGGMGC